MSPQNKKVCLNRHQLGRSRLAMMSIAAASVLDAPTAIAHKVKTANDVAATYHLEPNHNPKAGETATVWFALTKAGGKQIPLSACDCKLEVQQAGKSIETITLKAIDAEQYQGIPGGEVIFPKVGIYQLVFSGKAKDEASFQPFELTYDVTVQPGQAANNPATTTASTAQTPAPDAPPPANNPATLSWLIPALLTTGAIVALGLAFWTQRDHTKD